MPVTGLDAVFFCEEVPIIEIRDGLVHITQQIGGMRLERVMRLSTFNRLLAAGHAALSEYSERGTAEVIPLPVSRTKDEAANGH